jgi:hypothetical protein
MTMKRVKYLTNESAARIKAKAREEARNAIPNMKIPFGDTEEGIKFKAVQEVVEEEYSEHGEFLKGLLLYQYGMEKGTKRRRSHVKKLNLSKVY